MSDIKMVCMTADELGELIRKVVGDEVDRIVGEKLGLAKKPDDGDELLNGAKEISSELGISKSSFWSNCSKDMVDMGFLYYVGRTIHGTKAKVREYRDQYMAN